MFEFMCMNVLLANTATNISCQLSYPATNINDMNVNLYNLGKKYTFLQCVINEYCEQLGFLNCTCSTVLFFH